MPSEPVISIHEFRRSCVVASKTWRKQVSGAIRQAATPMPMSSRATLSDTRPRARAKAAQPTTATLSSTSCTRRGPKRSSARPSGSCSEAKPRK